MDDEATDAYSDGGAVAALRASPTITNCVFRNNAARYGAAIWAKGSDAAGPAVTGCDFLNNRATAEGGALSYDSRLWAANSRFFGNTAARGGAIAVSAGRYTIIQQCLFWSNSATNGAGGAILDGSDGLTIASSTIYGNTATADGGGIFHASTTAGVGSVSVTNSILTGNSTPNSASKEAMQLTARVGERVTVDHSIVAGLSAYSGYPTDANLDADPQFVAPTNAFTANFQLLGNSPAINSGNANSSYAQTIDLAGEVRVQGGAPDLGAYEFAGSAPSAAKVTTSRSGASGSVVNVFGVTPPTGSSGYQWEVDTGNGVWVALTADGVYSGVNSANLTITGAPFASNGYRYRLSYSVSTFPGLTYYSPISRLAVGLPRIYVKAGSNGANDGSSWANAYSSLRAAVDAAEAGSEIWVAAGTYYPTKVGQPADANASLRLRSGIAIYGGFAGTEFELGQRDFRANVTIISGKLADATGDAGTAASKIIFNNEGQRTGGACDRSGILDGFTVSGAAQYGVLNVGASPTIRNCVFKNNLGPSILNYDGSNAFVGNCEFRSNTANTGAAISSSNSSVAIEVCLFADNVATSLGDSAGAVQISGSGTSTITHCTFANNSAVRSGAAISTNLSTGGKLAVRNSVVWGNTVADSTTPAAKVAIASYNSDALTFANCDLQGATSTANGCFSLDPLFLDPANGDYSTARISPLRVAGSATYETVSTVDLAGNSRLGSAPAIGAYEGAGGAITGVRVVSLPPSSVKLKTTGGGVATFSYAIPSGDNVSFTWQVKADANASWVDVTSGGRYAITTDTGGSTLTISGISAADSGLQARIVNSSYSYTSPGSTLTVIVPTILYVDAAATGSKNGTSWANAYTDLAVALNAATEANEVWVAGGTYTGTDSSFVIPQNVEIYGGFAGGETQRTDRDAAGNPTILRPAAGIPTVSCVYDAAGPRDNYSTLDGFVFENATAAGAAYIFQRSPYFKNCVFRNNAGSVVSKSASPTFIDCVFSGGSATAVASTSANAAFFGCRFENFVTDENTSIVTSVGYPYNVAPSVNFTDCVFSGNRGGGVLLNNGAALTVSRGKFFNNVGSYSGAVATYSGTVTIDGSLFVRNSGGVYAGAVLNRGSNLTIRNSTFADNSARTSGGALQIQSDAVSTTVLNSIFWGNRVTNPFVTGLTLETQQIMRNGTAPFAITYSVVEGLDALAGSSNQKFYPFFANVSADDYRLADGSPAINAAQRTSSSATAKDLALMPRLYGNSQDIGAYEFQAAKTTERQLTAVPTSPTVPALSSLTLTYAGNYPFQWQVFDPNTQTWSNISSTSPSFQIVTGSNTTTLTVPSAGTALNGTQIRVVAGSIVFPPVTITVREPQVFRVDSAVASSGDGKSWGGAFKTVAEAVAASIAISGTNSAEIWVKAGTYPVGTTSAPLAMSWQVQLYGGFAGTETTRDQRDWAANVTTLTSAGSGVMIEDNGIAVSNRGNSLLDGFTISGATQAGYSMRGASPTIRNCTFDGASSGVVVGQGARATLENCTFQNLTNMAVRAAGDALTLDGCAFLANTTTNGIATVQVSVGSTAITGSRFVGNVGGPVLDFVGSPAANVTISRSKFTDNTASYALISLYPRISLTMDNSVLANNVVTGGSVVRSEGPTVKIDYCTIANNRHQGSAIGVSRASQTAVRYSILWGNRNTLNFAQRQQIGVIDLKAEQAVLLPQFASGATLSVTNGTLEGVEEGDNFGNRGGDPLFVNPDAGDFSLSANSPAIGRGDSVNAALYGNVDLAGAPRRYPLPSGQADTGAYEFQSAPSATLQIFGDYGSRRVVVGTTTVFSLFAPSDPVQWQVDRNDGQGFVNLVAGGDVAIKSTNRYNLTLSNLTLAMSGYRYRFVIAGGHPYTSPAATLTVVGKPIRYVNAAATGTGDGTSWANAYPALSTALSDLASNNRSGNPEITAEVWVAAGNYAAGGQLSRGVEIYGGFVGGETARSQRSSTANPAIIAVGSGTVFSYTDKTDSIYGDPVVDGLTLSATSGFIISKDSGKLSLVACRLLGAARNGAGDFPTKGIYSGGGTTVVDGCTFTRTGAAMLTRSGDVATVRNSIFENGGPISCVASTLTVEDSTFRNNVGASITGGNYETAATVTVVRSRFLGNVNADGPGAIRNSQGTMVIRQSLFVGNSGRLAGAITNDYGGTLQLFGVTIADNVVSTTDFAGAIYQNGAYLGVENSILWGNVAATSTGPTRPAQIVRAAGQLVNSNSAIQVATLTPGVGVSPYAYDPRFVGGGDYRLSSSSPYIGVGQTGSYYVQSGETDLDGNARLTAGKLDFGAYENGSSVNPIYATQPADSTTQAEGGEVVLTIGGATAGNFGWQFSTDGGATWQDIGQLPAGFAHSETSTASGTVTLYTITLGSVPLDLSGTQFRVANGGFATAPTTVTVVPPDVMYVRATATAGGDGTSWATAYPSLETAINAVTVKRRIIRVAAGTYVSPGGFNVTKRMGIYGGYPAAGGDENSRDPAANPTILSGAIPNSSSRVANVVYLYGGDPETEAAPVLLADTVIDGLTIQDGQTGLKIIRANATLRNLLIQGNTQGGVYGYRAGGLIENCRVVGNTGSVGAGAYFVDSEARVTRCAFRGNVATLSGGGVFITNTGRRFPTPMTFDQVLISGNAAGQQGGGVSVSNVVVNFSSCTIAGNWAGAGGGAGVYGDRVGVTLRNSILWGNRSATGTLEKQQIALNAFNGGEITASSCDIERVQNYANGNLSPAVDPLFLSGIVATSAGSVSGDFRVNSASAVIDAGNNGFATSYTFDLAGAARRFQGGTVDIGAYEYQAAADAPLAITEQPVGFVYADGAVNEFRVRLATAGFTFQWESSKGGADFENVEDGAIFSGAQTNTLTVLKGEPTLEGTFFRCKVTANAGGSARSLSAQLTVYPSRYYVNASAANDTGDGFTWATAMKTLSRATSTMRINPASGVEVWVAAGTYSTTVTGDVNASFALKGKVSLYGGFAGNETTLSARDVAANATILSGVSGTTSVFSGVAGATTRVDGFTISGGLAGIANAGGVTMAVANCSFSGLAKGIVNTIGRTPTATSAADTVTVADCRFIGLTSVGIEMVGISSSGGGSLDISDSYFASSARGIVATEAVVRIVRSEFRGNGGGAVDGGAVSLVRPRESAVESSLFSGNRGRNGGGISVEAGNLTVRNSTFTGNRAETYGGGLYFSSAGQGGSVDLANSIVWDNSSASQGNSEVGQVLLSSGAAVYNNSVQNANLATGTFRATSGNVSADPLFITPITPSAAPTTAGDFRLSSLSKLINSGDNARIGSSLTDLAKVSRTFDSTVDLGAYELQAETLKITSHPVDATAGLGVSATFSVGVNASDATYLWQQSTDGGKTFSDIAASADFLGTTTASLTVAGRPAYEGIRFRVHVTTPQPGDVISTAATYHYSAVTAQTGLSLRNATLVGATSSAGFTVPGGALAGSVTDAAFAIHGSQTGRLTLANGLLTGVTVSGDSVTLQTAVPFKAGELIEVTTNSNVQRADGFGVSPLVYQFTGGATSRYGIFPTVSNAGTVPVNPTATATGDLDDDGFVDLVVGGTNGAAVLLNDGTGAFPATAQTLGSGAVSRVALGSLGFTTLLDVVLVKADGAVEIWKNNGDNSFALVSTIAGQSAKAVALADFNADGALDLFIATSGASQVWLNNGPGAFADSAQRLGTTSGMDVAVGDVDNDNDLDVCVATGSTSSLVWKNNGAAIFTAAAASPNSIADRVALVDLNRDGKLDFISVRANRPNVFLAGAGDGTFASSVNLTGIGGGEVNQFSVGDFDGDGLPDLLNGSTTIWRNGGPDSAGRYSFQPWQNQPALAVSGPVQLADLDRDGRLDLVYTTADGSIQMALYRVIDKSLLQNATASLGEAEFGVIRNGTLGSVKILTLPAHGTLTQNGAAVTVGQEISSGSLDLTYVPSTNFRGFDTFAWEGSTDGQTYDGVTREFNLVVQHVPQGIVPLPDAITVIQGGTASGLDDGSASVLTNDDNADPLTAKVLVPPTQGTLVLDTDGTFTYSHNGSERPRTDQFTYEVTDTASGEKASAVVSITITNRNDPPSVLTYADANRYEQRPVGEALGTFTVEDPDSEFYPAPAAVLSLVSGEADNAQFTISGTNLYAVAPLTFADGGTRTIRVRATDPDGLTLEKTFAVSVKSLPVAVPRTATVAANGDVDITLAGTNAEGRAITSYAIATPPTNGRLYGIGADVVYLPAKGFSGNDSFTYTVSDGTINSAPATVSVNVFQVNRLPTLTTTTLTATENEPLNFTLTGADADNDPLTFSVSEVSSMGTITGTSPNFTFTPYPDKFGDFKLFVFIDDGHGVQAGIFTINGTITEVDYPPIAVSQSVITDQNTSVPITLQGGDRNGRSVTFGVLAPPAHGRLSSGGKNTVYTPDVNFHGTDSFQFKTTSAVGVSEVATVSIVVNHTNQSPVAVNQSVVTDQTKPVAITLAASDSDDDLLAYTILRSPQHGVLTGVGADRTYTPDGIFAGSDSFEYRVTDGLLTATAVVSVTVNEVDLPPIANSKTVTGHAKVPATFAVSGSDPKGLPITYQIASLPAHGTLTGTFPTSVTYTPETNYVGSDSFTFQTNNGTLASDVATVTIDLPKDLIVAPKAADDFAEVFPHEAVTIDVLANDTDFYDDPLTIVSVATPNTGAVAIVDNKLVFTAGETTGNGNATFGYTVSNGSEFTATALVVVKVVNQDLVVTSSADSGPGTLRAILATIENSSRPQAEGWNVTFSINVTGQAIQLNSPSSEYPDSALAVSANVNLVSNLSPIPVLTVDGGGSPLRAFRVLPGGSLSLSGLTISGGAAHQGGAILNEGTLTVDDSTLRGNTAFAANGGPGGGGAIYSTGTTSLVNATIKDNVADVAGGFYQVGDGAAATAVFDNTIFSGHSESGDFLSTAINGGTASIDAMALSTETPTAPWFGALPKSVTIANELRTKLPVQVDGDAFALTANSSNPAMPSVNWTGRGTSRTLTLDGFTPVDGAQTRLTATASDGSVSFTQHTNVTVDPASHRPPVAVDDAAAITTNSSVLIPVLANDMEPDGGALTIASVTQPASGGSVAIEGNKIRFTHDGTYNGVFYDFTYTVENAWGESATATVSLRRIANPLFADSSPNSLRDALDVANRYYNPDGWTIEVYPNSDGGTLLVPSTVGDRGVGNSAFLVTGRVTIDASAAPGFTIQRGQNGPSMRLFRITDEGDLTFKHVALDGGIAKHGGVLLNEGTTALDHSTVAHGSGVSGGGIFNEGLLTLDAATISENSAIGFGGGLFNRNGEAQIAGSSLVNNVATDGGAVHLSGDGDYSIVQLIDSTVGSASALNDLSADVSGAGMTVLTAAGTTTVAAPGDTWVDPIADLSINETAEVPFTFTAPAAHAISAESQNEAVIATGGLTLTDLTGASGKLNIQSLASGYAEIAVLATKGGSSFGQLFTATVNSANNANPIAAPDAVTIYPGETVSIPVLANDTDPEGAPINLSEVNPGGHGTTAISGKSVVYTHDGSDSGADSFNYSISDGFGGTATGTVTITLRDTRIGVTTTNPAGAGSIRAALDFAAANPINATWKIVFDPSLAGQTIFYGDYGPYTNGYTMFQITGQVLLDASQAPGLKIQSTGGQSGPPVRFFHVHENASLELRSLTLSGGVLHAFMPDEGGLGGGGAVLNEGEFIARDVTFLNNQAPSSVGGAISSCGTALIEGCTFTNNSATVGAGNDYSVRQVGVGLGGAIFQLNGELTVMDTLFVDDLAVSGAAIYAVGDVDHAELIVTGSTMSAANATGSQIKVIASNAGTVTRSGSQNVVPSGEDTPWIASIAGTTSISGLTDIPVTLGVPTEAYTIAATAAPATNLSSLQLTGAGADRTLTVVPAGDTYGPVDLTVTLVNGPITVNETFVGSILAPAPDSPTGLTASAVSDSQIALAWTDNATTESGYSVERSADGTTAWTVVATDLAANSTKFVDAELAATTEYFYRVHCDLGGSTSADSNVASATTAATIGDGIPGSWRYQYFGDGTTVVAGAEPASDPDGDGFTNRQEYLAGTDPLDSLSALTAKLTRTGGSVVLDFPTVIGKIYRVEVADALGSPTTWTVLASDIAGTGEVVQYTDPNSAAKPQRFYRVSIQPASGPALVSTSAMGYLPIGLQSGSDTLTGIPFTRAPEFIGSVASISGNVLKMRGTPAWSVDQFAFVSGSQPKTYYVQIGTHPSVNPNEGRIYEVRGNLGDSLAIDSNGDDLSAIAAGTPVSIIPYWTLNTLFPASDANVSFTPGHSAFALKTQIVLPNTSGEGINLAPVDAYYFISKGANVGWRKASDPITADHGDDPLPPDVYLIIRNPSDATALSLTITGTIAPKTMTTPLSTVVESLQDNYVTLARPVATTLDGLGLSPAAGNFVASPTAVEMKDQLLLFAPGTPGINPAPTRSYFYISDGANVGWRSSDDAITTDHGTDVIPAGCAMIIRKSKTTDGATNFWLNSMTY